MNTLTFKNLLSENPNKVLAFRYAENLEVPSDYHITEVKNVIIESIDCGANSHQERQTVVQLWSPRDGESRHGMSANKAKSIFDKVDTIIPINDSAEILFEYGDKHVSTTQFKVAQVENSEGKLIIELVAPITACKPRLAGATAACC